MPGDFFGGIFVVGFFPGGFGWGDFIRLPSEQLIPRDIRSMEVKRLLTKNDDALCSFRVTTQLRKNVIKFVI